jgi:glycosyltransferase involved in cell wall biosynthesis
MIKAPVSVCIIVKNEPLLEKCLLSLKNHVEEIVVVDTGSTDGLTIDIAKKYADIFEQYSGCNDPDTGLINDFSNARTRSFQLATKKWCFWVDADDIIDGAENLHKIISEYEASGNTSDVAFLFKYEYSYDESGRSTCTHYRERLISNVNSFHWYGKIHEVLVPNDGANVQMIQREEVVFKHQRQYSTKTPEPGRNLRIMRKYFEEIGGNDARQMYYLGLECANAGLFDEAIQHLSKYIDISGWDDERVMACLKIVEIYQGLAQYENGLKWGFKAIEIKENWFECYFAVAKMFYFMALKGGSNEAKYWQKCAHFAKLGLTYPTTQTLLFINPNDRDIEVHRYLNMALNKLGDVKGALDSAEEGLKNNENDPFLKTNKKLYQNFLSRNQIVLGVNDLLNNGEINQSGKDTIISIINSYPVAAHTTNVNPIDVASEINKLIIKNNDNPLDIVFYAGNGIEEYTPETIKRTGIGGSELMLCEMTKRLAALGHKVRVYNSCGNGEGTYDGVQYFKTEKYGNLDCDVLIASRDCRAIDDAYAIKAKLKLIWVHDLCINNYKNEIVLKADKVLALSNFHKQFLMNLHNLNSEHIITTRNGLDPTRFENKNIKRNRFKCISSSSPDRYLPILLHIWPRIKQQVPQAELHICYGFKNWEYAAQWDKGQADLIVHLKNKLEEMKSIGVVFHDRLSQDQLANEFLSAGCWLYSNWFSETFCISAVEAQAAGLRVITSPIAALNEVVADRGTLISGEWTSQDYQDRFVDATVIALLKEDDSDRETIQNYVKQHYSLDILADEWSDMFYNLIELKKINPLVPYEPTKHFK